MRPTSCHRGRELEDAHDAGDAGELAATIARRTREPGVIRVICPPFVCLARSATRSPADPPATSRSARRTSTTS
jgi:hypothetical protein